MLATEFSQCPVGTWICFKVEYGVGGFCNNRVLLATGFYQFSIGIWICFQVEFMDLGFWKRERCWLLTFVYLQLAFGSNLKLNSGY